MARGGGPGSDPDQGGYGGNRGDGGSRGNGRSNGRSGAPAGGAGGRGTGEWGGGRPGTGGGSAPGSTPGRGGDSAAHARPGPLFDPMQGPVATRVSMEAQRDFERTKEDAATEERERTWGWVGAGLGVLTAIATGGLSSVPAMASAFSLGAGGMKAGQSLAGLAGTKEVQGLMGGMRQEAAPDVQAALGRTPPRTPTARGEGGERHPAASVTRPGSAEAGAQPETRETNPLAGITDADESVYWRPQPVAADVSWLARVNADIERARQAGRQRAMV